MVVFSGTVESDYLKYLPGRLDDKEKLLDFAASDFLTYRDTLLGYVKANFPLDYNNFEESDFGILLIELMAAVGHIQSHKSDYLANQNFLRTASERSSVKKLLELIGIRMKGPISAVADASITFTSEQNGTSSLTLRPSDRTITVTSPEDSNPLTFTIYKVNTDGTVDLDQNSTDLVFNFEPVDAGNQKVITSAVLMEGAFVVESGSFTSPDSVKTIQLTQSPYVERSAQIFVEGTSQTQGIYKEEENVYFASGRDDKVFQVTTDEQYKASILFGDNTVGMSPAINDTYTITYRVGGGSRGNIANSFINSNVNGVVNENSSSPAPLQVTVQNTSVATGGADAESVEKAKRYAPLKFRTQDRVVTLADYKSFVNAFISNYGSNGKATASVRRAYSSANIIDVFVLEKASNTQLKRATQEYKRQLLEALQDKKMLTDEPVIVDGLIRTLDLSITITLDREYRASEPEIISSARDIIENYFNVDNTDFGEPFVPQDLARTIVKEPRIRFSTINNVDSTITINHNEIIQLNNFTINVNYI